MEKEQHMLPLSLYYKNLTEINGVKFTSREVDVISCLLNGKAANISNFLLIGKRTVEGNLSDIRQKAGCLTNRHQIIDFIEKSGKLRLIQNEYYSALCLRVLFERKLEDIAKKIKKPATCLLVYEKGKEYPNYLIPYLKDHLKRIGFEIEIHLNEGKALLSYLADIVSVKKTGHILCVTSKDLSQSEEKIQKFSNVIFLMPQEAATKDIHTKLKLNHINVFEEESYYLSFFDILKRLLLETNFDGIIEEFKQEYNCRKPSFENKNSQQIFHELPPEHHEEFLQETPEECSQESPEETSQDAPQESHQEVLQENPELQKEIPSLSVKNRFLTTKMTCFFIGFITVVSVLSIWLLFFNETAENQQQDSAAIEESLAPSIGPNFIPPSESTLLNRSEFIAQIDDKFKKQERGIQTLALIGIGGAGKTTLARHYANQQKVNVVWEINAETHESLVDSFDKLAEALSKTEEDKKILKELREIKAPAKKENEILTFVKERLKNLPGWFLIYDNVEYFTDIQNYFPLDKKIWGQGKVILTTQNHNVQNSSRISEIIMIQKLNEDQKLQLFTQIMHHGESKELTAAQKKEALEFLKQIPPFPLDVSVAVRYLKTTNISYGQYLDHLNKQDENFLALQEELQKADGEYAKTRYSIIILPLEKLVSTDKNFVDLLFLVSLIDSQKIPRELLEKYKGGAIVDNFIYFLKNYSLIDHEPSPSSATEKTFSIHRSTQKISLVYLIRISGLEKTNQVIQSLFYALGQYTNEVIEKRNPQKMKILIEHYNTLLKYNQLTNPLRAMIYGALGRIYCLLGRYEEAKEFLEKHLSIISKNDNKNPTELLQVLSYLANTYREVGDYEKAKDLLTQSLMIYKSQSSKDYLGISQALIFLGNIYRELGNYEEAKNLFEESCTLHEKYHPENHNFRAWVLSSLGNVYKELGDYKKSKDLLEKSLAVYEKHLSHTHNYYVWTLILLGETHEKLGYYEKAKELFEQARKINKEWHPENDSFRAWILARLGDSHGELGKSQESKNLLEQALTIYKNSHFSEEHLYVTWILMSLGNVCKDLGDYAKAKIWLNKSLGIYEKHFGKNHVETARVLSSLGHVYLLEGRLSNAENLLYRSFNIFQKSNHSDIYMVFEGLAALYLKKSKISFQDGDRKKSQEFSTQAINYLKNAQEIIKTHFPQDSSHLIRIQSKLKKPESL